MRYKNREWQVQNHHEHYENASSLLMVYFIGETKQIPLGMKLETGFVEPQESPHA